MPDTDDAVGAILTVTSARTLYWTAETDIALTGDPKIAILGAYKTPDTNTVWSTAVWEGADVEVNGVHTRRFSRLVAGPNGPTTGDPLVVSKGEHSTWARLGTAIEQIEVEGQLLVVE